MNEIVKNHISQVINEWLIGEKNMLWNQKPSFV